MPPTRTEESTTCGHLALGAGLLTTPLKRPKVFPMELCLRPRVVWFVETCGHADAAGPGEPAKGGPASQRGQPVIQEILA